MFKKDMYILKGGNIVKDETGVKAMAKVAKLLVVVGWLGMKGYFREESYRLRLDEGI